ncbi:tail tape measure protein [Sphingomonas lacunae]|uniref:Tail tape measure protein n=1 Tax=Sphingomonas lacunae TaxID=2698828 RepID=A0A6M4ATF3_9SPHN|nr:tail tape measure protein [Sphingomonas lacunae]QJQ32387.1 tail tape measure protein [Sphingomonas lacunae]
MADEIDTLVIGVRADVRAFSADVAAMRAGLDGPLADGAERAGRAIEGALLRAVRTGKFGFDDLRRVALSTMAEIARSALSAGVGSLFGGGDGKAGGGLLNLASSLIPALLGAPGRATGGPVAPGQAYRVGERGPEWFVPTSAGRVETGAVGGDRHVRITVNVGGGAGADPQRMAASGRQIAQAVRRAIEAAGD